MTFLFDFILIPLLHELIVYIKILKQNEKEILQAVSWTLRKREGLF